MGNAPQQQEQPLWGPKVDKNLVSLRNWKEVCLAECNQQEEWNKVRDGEPGTRAHEAAILKIEYVLETYSLLNHGLLPHP